ncbi:MAG: hypothetical protein M1813_000426 [Trichoglossum hirsutum]|nr:MAG: hypothetical protein M1813_000426 [Trichoglossum hirsutum]
MALVYDGPCDFRSPRDLVPLAVDPNLNLTSLVTRCEDACLTYYGNGNPDLAGVGVVLSYVLQLSFAILYGPVLLLGAYIPLLKPFVRRLSSKPQSLNLWSQLWFGLAISVACAVRQFQQPPHYESIIIVALDIVNTMCGLLSISAYYGEIKHLHLFSVLVLAISVLSILASSMPIARTFHVKRLLRVCETFGLSRGFMQEGANAYHLRLYTLNSSLPAFVSVVILMAALFAVWVLEWRRAERRRRRRGANEPQPRKLNKLGSWVPEAFVVAASLTLTALAVTALVSIRQMRVILKNAYGGASAEDVWGFGQIGAPFAWAPLLCDTIYRLLGLGEEDEEQQNNIPLGHVRAIPLEK